LLQIKQSEVCTYIYFQRNGIDNILEQFKGFDDCDDYIKLLKKVQLNDEKFEAYWNNI
jgi:hypothetical protein